MRRLLHIELKGWFIRKLPLHIPLPEEHIMHDDLETGVWRGAADLHGPSLELVLR